MAPLEGRNLTKRFGGVVALNDVSFSVKAGETVGLIGPNGAGKTTLFEIITGTHHPDKGTVRFGGQNVTGLPPYRRCRQGLAKTHQIARPFEGLTIQENVAVGAYFGGGEHDPFACADRWLSFVELEDDADDTPDVLGVDGIKRLEIARGLATDPEVILLDEVAAGLDPTEVEAMIDLIRNIKEQGRTVFLIDHVIHALMRVSERVLVLHNGQVLARGTPEQIRDDPQVVDAYLGRDRGDRSSANR